MDRSPGKKERARNRRNERGGGQSVLRRRNPGKSLRKGGFTKARTQSDYFSCTDGEKRIKEGCSQRIDIRDCTPSATANENNRDLSATWQLDFFFGKSLRSYYLILAQKVIPDAPSEKNRSQKIIPTSNTRPPKRKLFTKVITVEKCNFSMTRLYSSNFRNIY